MKLLSAINSILKLQLLLVLLITLEANAQAPGLFNYQGIARDAVGNPLVRQTMSLKFLYYLQPMPLLQNMKKLKW